MDVINTLLIILIILALYLFIKKNKQINTKNPAVKKHEIVDNYKHEMKQVIIKYENNPTKQKEEKLKLLKKINHELSMNLFFDKEESKKILSDLSMIS